LSIGDETLASTSIYPNPFSDRVNINSTTKIKKASIVDMPDEMVLIVNKNSERRITKLNLTQLFNGMCFITHQGDTNQKKNLKLLKKSLMKLLKIKIAI
jgi:hypothetical protein